MAGSEGAKHGLLENEGLREKARGRASGEVLGRCESQQVTEVPFEFRTNHKQ